MLENLKERLAYINKARFSIGIHDDIGDKIEEVTIFNLDGSTTKTELPLADIMYYTEYGTITLPAKKVLRTIARKIKYDFQKTLPELIHHIVHDNYDEEDIRNFLILYNEQKINNLFIEEAINEILASDNVISGILGEEEDTHYTYDLKKLKKFIKSKVFFSS